LPFFLRKPFHFQDVLSCFSKRNTESIHSLLQGKGDELQVPFRNGVCDDSHPGDAQPFVGKKRATDDRPAENLLARHLLHLKLDEAVIEENQISKGYAFRQLLVFDRDLSGCARKVLNGQNDLIPRFQQERLLQEFADSYLGAGKVRHDHAMALKFFRHCTDAPNVLPVAVQGTVGKVEPCYVHAQQHQPFQNGLRAGRRADGADDFGFMGRQSHGLFSLLFILFVLCPWRC